MRCWEERINIVVLLIQYTIDCTMIMIMIRKRFFLILYFIMSQRHQSVRCKPVLRIRGFAVARRWDVRYRLPTFELATEIALRTYHLERFAQQKQKTLWIRKTGLWRTHWCLWLIVKLTLFTLIWGCVFVVEWYVSKTSKALRDQKQFLTLYAFWHLFF